MTSPQPPSHCAVALKEWATVLEAMKRGEQLVLIRKGGLVEPGSGFELRASSFVFYPTFEHQAVNYLRSPYRVYFEEALKQRAPDGQVRVDLFGVAVASQQSRDPGVIERLRAFHIYNEEFVQQRLRWQADQPLMIVVVRAFQLEVPQRLTVLARYAGCTSWVELEGSLSLTGARPVLDDQTFQHRLQALTPLLA